MFARTLKPFILVLAFLLLAPSANAEEASGLAGHYYLSGSREVGSELLLHENHSFEWMLSYGAVDQYASGTWSADGQSVTLIAQRPTGTPPFRLFRNDEIRIKKPAEPGTWIAIVGMPRVGPVGVPIEVIFEASDKHQLSAMTDRNGDAIVKPTKGANWKRVGLRRQGSQEEPQWFVVPQDRIKDRIVCIAIDDMGWIAPPPFEKIMLQVQDDGLQMEGGGTYRKEPSAEPKQP